MAEGRVAGVMAVAVKVGVDLATGVTAEALRQQLQCRECSTTQQMRDSFSVYGELKTRARLARLRWVLSGPT